jgi:SAM-dependent methyltransferase
MDFKTVSTYKRLGVPDALINTIFVVIIILVLAPYVEGVDFRVFKVPVFSAPMIALLRWIGPVLLAGYLVLFLPVWQLASESKPGVQSAKAVHPGSKYVLQSTPDIILNELQKFNVNTDGIEIVSGFTVNDLKKRVSILNPQLSSDSINRFVELARETAFTTKYAAPKEDEKLERIDKLQLVGIAQWHTYLQHFLYKLGIAEVSNINVIDVGIGNAYASQIFLSLCAHLTGVDISQEALNFARTKLPSAKLTIGCAENLIDIESFSYDLYISLRTYQSTLFDMKESLHEAYRVLAKGGGVVISIPVMYLKKDDAGNIIDILKGLIPQGQSIPSLDYAIDIARTIEKYMTILGFRDIEIDTQSPFEIYIGARK